MKPTRKPTDVSRDVFNCLKLRRPTGATIDDIYSVIALWSRYSQLDKPHMLRLIKHALKEYIAKGRVGGYLKIICVRDRYFMVPFQVPPRGRKRNPTPKKVAGRSWRGNCNSCGLQLGPSTHPENACPECGSGDVEWY